MNAIARLVVGVAMAATAMIFAAAPAQAADPLCDSYSTQFAIFGQGALVYVPATDPGTRTNWRCNMIGNDTSSKNWGVVGLQRTLNNCYYGRLKTNAPWYAIPYLAEDGYFGPTTMNALINVQKYIGAPADGDYGKFTRERMDFWAGGTQPNQYGDWVTWTDCFGIA
jgi:hypothetical protein